MSLAGVTLPTVAMPTFLQVEPVGQCNLRCQMCPIQFRKDGPPYGPPAFMKWETFTALVDGFPDLVRLAHSLGIGSVFVQHLCHDFGESSLPAHYAPMRDFVDGQTLLAEDPARVERFFGEARAVAKELGVDLRLPPTRPRFHPPGTPGPQRCDWPWKGPYVSYDGQAMPCCMVATPDRVNFGNLAEQGAE